MNWSVFQNKTDFLKENKKKRENEKEVWELNLLK